MRRQRVALAAAIVIGLSLPALAQEEPAPPPEMQAMFAAMEKAATPGPNHELLASFAGEWEFTTRYWFDPEAPPQEAKGTMTSTVILGGRFVLDRVKSEMMGQPFEGIGITGFDNVSGKFVSVWADTSATGIMTSEGSYDAATSTWTMIGSYADPLTGEPKQVRMVTTIGENRHVMEFFEAGPDGAEQRTMEMVYTRR